MRILQLCCFTDLWNSIHEVESIDLRLDRDIFDYPDKYANEFDLVCAAPPCDQFTLASAWMWEDYPEQSIKIAKKCLSMCLETGLYWFLENPPGRIEKFIPELTKYRILTWTGLRTNKQYNIYGNFLILKRPAPRYGKLGKSPRLKKTREMWQPDLIENIEICL
jgi:hypothetical protein